MYSRWKNEEEIFEIVLSKITNHKFENDEEVINAEITPVFRETKEISIDHENQDTSLTKFNFFKINVIRNTPYKSVPTESNSSILIYEKNREVFYIIDRANNKSNLRKLRKLHTYEKPNIIIEKNFDFITGDFFYWLIFKVIKYNGIVSPHNNLTINKITGFRGKAKDQLATITGSGDEILSQLGTLAFIIENESITTGNNEIEKIELMVKDTLAHSVITFSLNLKGEVDLNLPYSKLPISNNLNIEEFSSNNEKEAFFLLQIYELIIPKLIEAYDNDCANNDWNVDIKENFFKDIGTSIIDTIRKYRLTN